MGGEPGKWGVIGNSRGTYQEMKDDYAFLSSLEKKVWDWLVKNNISFDTERTFLEASGELGSAKVDFVIPDRNLLLRVMGSYWHSGLEAKARDELSKERLMGEGWIVVDLWEPDLTDEKIEGTMRKAIRGEEVVR